MTENAAFRCVDPEGTWIREQQELARKGLCILCGEHPSRCDCQEYETYDRRPLEGSDTDALDA